MGDGPFLSMLGASFVATLTSLSLYEYLRRRKCWKTIKTGNFGRFQIYSEVDFASSLLDLHRTAGQPFELEKISHAEDNNLFFDIGILNERIQSCGMRMLDVERISVFILSQDGKNLVNTGSVDIKGIEIPSNSGIAGYVYSTGEMVVIDECYKDPRFSKRVDDMSGFETKNMMCVPVLYEEKECVGVIQAINCKHSGGKFQQADIDRISALAIHASIAIKRQALYKTLIHERKRANALLQILKLQSEKNDSSIMDRLLEIAQLVEKVLVCERCSIWLVDHGNQECWAITTKDHAIKGRVIKFGTGIVGNVAQNGKLINLSDVYSDSRFDRTTDDMTKFTTRNLLCLPVSNSTNNKKEQRTVAVIQAINKGGGSHFDEDDVDILAALGVEIHAIIRTKILEVAMLKAYHSDDKGESMYADMEASFLEQYSAETLKKPNTRLKEIKEDDFKIIGYEEASNSFSPPNGSRQDHVSASKDMEAFNDWDFNVFITPAETLVEYAISIFKTFDFLTKYNIEESKLRKFVNEVRSRYNNNLFHNFLHGFSVFHITYMIITAGKVSEKLKSIDIFASLVAALCHDLDHPGHSNGFEINSRSPLAILYSDDAVLERHHCNVTFEILQNPAFNILSNLDAEDTISARNAIIKAILGTDMFKHMKHVEDLERLSKTFEDKIVNIENSPRSTDSSNDDERIQIISAAVHCADISGQAMRHDIALIWGDMCRKEFADQARKEIETNITHTPFMHGLDDELTYLKLQLGFSANVVLPLWSNMAKCFPDCTLLVNNLENTISYYKDEILKLEVLEEKKK